MVTQLGMSQSLGNMDLNSEYSFLSSETKQKIEDEVRRILDESSERVRSMLTERRKELDLLAKALVTYEVLDVDEMRRVIKGEKLAKLEAKPNQPIKQPELKAPPPPRKPPRTPPGMPPGLGGPPGLDPGSSLGGKVSGLEQTPQ